MTSNGEHGTGPIDGHDAGPASPSVILDFDVSVNSNADEELVGIGAALVEETLAGANIALHRQTLGVFPDYFTRKPGDVLETSMPNLARDRPLVEVLIRTLTEPDFRRFRGFTGMWPPSALDVQAMMHQGCSQFMLRHNVSLASLADATAGFLTPPPLRTPPPSPVHDQDLLFMEMRRRSLEEESTSSLSRASSYDLIVAEDLNGM